MENCRVPRRQIQDSVGKRYRPLDHGRDPVRTPMQWDSGENARFTTGTPLLAVHPNRETVNGEAEGAEEASLLTFHRRLIALRNNSPALQHGEWIPAQDGSDCVISYIREIDSERKLIVVNSANARASVNSPVPGRKEAAVGQIEPSTHRS